MRLSAFYALFLATSLSATPFAGAQSGSGNYSRQNERPIDQTAPPELTLPAGALVVVRTTELVSSDKNKTGDVFTSVLDQPLVAQGWVVARTGQIVEGRIAEAQSAGRVKGVSRLGVELTELVLVDGRQSPIETELLMNSAGAARGNDAGAIGATTATGAAIGAIANGGEGAAIGAAIGAAAGIVGVLTTPGRPTVLTPETRLTFRLQQPVVISTQQSLQAFQPVTQRDYNDVKLQRNPPRYRNADAYPPPPPARHYPYPYYWDGAYWDDYYAPYGYYGYYVRTPSIIISSRIHGRSFRGRH